jgi:hypothetical protein
MGRKGRPASGNADLPRARFLAEHADALSPRVLPVTAPIFQENSRGEPELIGSSVLISLAEVRFLVTASHVLKRRAGGALLVGVSPEILPIVGQVTTLRTLNAQSEDQDHIDIGIVRLEGGSWGAVATSSFASWNELDVGAPVLVRHSYALVGFPYSYNKQVIEGDRMKSVAYRMIGLECTEEAYLSVGRNPNTNVMVGFDRDATWGEHGMRTAPDLYGASGSGLWRFGRRVRNATSAPLLSAVAIEWQKKGQHRHVLGTRIPVVIHALTDEYDDVRAFVKERM